MSKKKESPSPLAEDAGDDTPSQSPTEITAVEGEDAPEVAPVVTEVPRAEPPASVTVTPETLHALDVAPVNSKIVVVQHEGATQAVLAGPNGTQRLPADDPASKLPAGACIRKVAEGKFVSEQQSPAVNYPDFVTETAGEAIAGFVDHFHPRDG